MQKKFYEINPASVSTFKLSAVFANIAVIYAEKGL